MSLPVITELNNYNTHIPILEFIFNNIETDNIFEYGMGSYSTPLFSKKFKNVIAVEMQDESWYEKIKSENLGPNVNLYCLLGEKKPIEFFRSLDTKFSCVFVDGHGGNRWECINEAFNKTDIIVAHDTETPGYNWNLVKLDDNYTWIDVINYNPWTSVITNNSELIEKIKSVFKMKTYV